jgi:YjbE family integral membrane protein
VDTASGLLSIIVIDLVLSGDNAIVIGLAAAPLPPGQRNTAIVLGGGLAILVRTTLTWLAVELLRVPAIGALGGLLLLWIAFKLLKQEAEAVEGVKQAATLGGAIVTIALADLVMSLDNVLGVAAAARGVVQLLVFGLVLSMSILMLGGTLIANLIDRFWWLAYVGTAVIAWTAADMVLNDPLVIDAIGGPIRVEPLIAGIVAAIVLLLAHYLHRHRVSRRSSSGDGD